jgi:hypothetical protein
MNELPAPFVEAWEQQTSGASPEALAVFLALASQNPATPASIAKRLNLPQANVLRALAELAQPTVMLISLQAERGKAGRRLASLNHRAKPLQALLQI